MKQNKLLLFMYFLEGNGDLNFFSSSLSKSYRPLGNIIHNVIYFMKPCFVCFETEESSDMKPRNTGDATHTHTHSNKF